MWKIHYEINKPTILFESSSAKSIKTNKSRLKNLSTKYTYIKNNSLFRRSKGFILEGFPRNADEVRYLAAAGYFPDGAITLNVQDSNIVERLMPPVLERWRQKRAKDLARLERKRNAQMKFRVSKNIFFIKNMMMKYYTNSLSLSLSRSN